MISKLFQEMLLSEPDINLRNKENFAYLTWRLHKYEEKLSNYVSIDHKDHAIRESESELKWSSKVYWKPQICLKKCLGDERTIPYKVRLDIYLLFIYIIRFLWALHCEITWRKLEYRIGMCLGTIVVRVLVLRFVVIFFSPPFIGRNIFRKPTTLILKCNRVLYRVSEGDRQRTPTLFAYKS